MLCSLLKTESFHIAVVISLASEEKLNTGESLLRMNVWFPFMSSFREIHRTVMSVQMCGCVVLALVIQHHITLWSTVCRPSRSKLTRKPKKSQTPGLQDLGLTEILILILTSFILVYFFKSQQQLLIRGNYFFRGGSVGLINFTF